MIFGCCQLFLSNLLLGLHARAKGAPYEAITSYGCRAHAHASSALAQGADAMNAVATCAHSILLLYARAPLPNAPCAPALCLSSGRHVHTADKNLCLLVTNGHGGAT
eukprot:414513-Pelagomonas_calceolata.AAC.7